MAEKKESKKKAERAERRCRRLLISTSDNIKTDEIYPQDYLDYLSNELKEAHQKAEEETELYRELLDSDNEEEKEIVENIDATLVSLQTGFSQLIVKIAKLSQNQKQDAVGEKPPESGIMKLQKFDPPKFNGEIRAFPAFITHYKKHVETAYGKDPFILLKCLSGDAEKLVKPVEENYDDMMKRLEIKYGSDEKQIDVILHDLKGIKRVSDGDHKALYKMVEIIENCWLDLKRMNLEAEMDTTSMLSTIEKLLPEIQKREWTLQKPSRPKFTHLLDFLIKEKNAIEYMSDDIRCEKGSQRSKVHLTEVEETKEDEKQNSVIINLLERQMESQRQLMEMVVQAVTRDTPGSSLGPRLPNNHLVNHRCWIHKSNGHNVTECNVFIAMGSTEKVDIVKKNRACFRCLQVGHASRQCLNKIPCEQVVEGNKKCNGSHHKLLHAAHIEGMIYHNAIHVVNASNMGNQNTVLLMISSVQCKGHSLGTLWDSGANTTLITHRAAHKLRLNGKNIFITITKVGNDQQSCASKEYIVPITDKHGKQWNIRAIGIDEITAEIVPTDVKDVTHLFQGINEEDIKRPTGKVELLVASDCCTLLPNKIQQSGNLQLMSNQFGYCIRGTHSLLHTSMSESNHVSIKLHHIATSARESDIFVEEAGSIHKNMSEFFNIENMGTCCAPKCGTCECGKWSNEYKNLTIAEEKELNMIRNGLRYDKEEKHWISDYPWTKNPKELPNNYTQALKLLKALERRLTSSGNDELKRYTDEIVDMERRGVARKLTPEELLNYDGPIHYIPHHAVYKPDSQSTKMRIVFNSSASFMGHVLNEYWAKGPDVINNLTGVLLRFRRGIYAYAGDIFKMYHAVRTSPLVQHTHRILWRSSEALQKPDQYVLTRVTFGDKPSGAIAIVAMRMTAEMSEDVYPRESEVIKDDSYVDDILSSTNDEEEVLSMTNGIDSVLEGGGFRIKQWVTNANLSEKSQSRQLNIVKSPEEKILGIWWNPESDKFFFKVQINFTKKLHNVHIGSDIIADNIDEVFPDILTRRMVLSQVAKLFDPLGFLIPFLLKSKILLRKSCTRDNENKSLEWDEHLPPDQYNEWKQFFKQLLLVENLTFVRCIRPEGSIGDPILIIFSDGSKEAFGACAYIRWKTDTNCFNTRLIMAKNRIAPTHVITIPRMELCGALISVRLRQTIEQELKLKFIRTLHIIDSTIVYNQIQNESHLYKTFEANRISEIQTKSQLIEWWLVPSKDNPADLTTRVADPMDLNENSIWINGPAYLKKDISLWPISQGKVKEGSNEILNVVMTNELSESIDNISEVVSIERFADVYKLLKVTAIVKNCIAQGHFVNIRTNHAEHFQQAEVIWIKHEQQTYINRWRTDLKNLGPKLNEDGVIVVGSRLVDGLKQWGDDLPMFLPQNSKYARLYCTTIHNEHHGGIDDTIARVRKRIWIPRIRPIVKQIKKNCIRCRFLEKRLLTQVMSPLPVERLQPSPAFYHSSVDIFGPFSIRDTIKKRTFGKGYGVIINCLYSRAVHLDVADGYDTKSFMLVLRRLVSIRGYPGTMRSDHGSQLICASKELKAAAESWDWDAIHLFGERHNMKWILNKSADAPWENGCSESLIKSTKKCLLQCIGTNRLTFSELQTALFEVSNILNERPIGTKTNDPNQGSYLCPNDLLLGRTIASAPVGQWNDCGNERRRLEVVNEIVGLFQQKWMQHYFPTLIIRKKWHTEARDLRVGDVVIVQPEKKEFHGHWRLAQVCCADKGRDQKVRSVTLRYKQQGHDKTYKGTHDTEIRRSVHKLVLILPVEEQMRIEA